MVYVAILYAQYDNFKLIIILAHATYSLRPRTNIPTIEFYIQIDHF